MGTHKKTGCKIDIIAEILNPLIRGWMNYFGKFNPSAMKGTLQCIERRIVKWAMCKYKNFRGRRRRAENGSALCDSESQNCLLIGATCIRIVE